MYSLMVCHNHKIPQLVVFYVNRFLLCVRVWACETNERKAEKAHILSMSLMMIVADLNTLHTILCGTAECRKSENKQSLPHRWCERDMCSNQNTHHHHHRSVMSVRRRRRRRRQQRWREKTHTPAFSPGCYPLT